MVGQCVPQPRGQGSPSAHNYASVNPPPLDLGGHGRSVTGGSCELPEYRVLICASPVGSYLWITAIIHLLPGLGRDPHHPRRVPGVGCVLDPGLDPARGAAASQSRLVSAWARPKSQLSQSSPDQRSSPRRARYGSQRPWAYWSARFYFGPRDPRSVIAIPLPVAAAQLRREL